MEWADFLTRMIENVVATIPALAVLASPLIYGLKKIKEVTSKFPDSVEETKETLTTRFNDTKVDLQAMLDETTQNLQEKVNGSLTSMKEQLSTYQTQLTQTKDQANMLVKQNKVYMDTLAQMVSQDPKLVQNGIASKLSSTFNMTNEELLAFPEKIMNDSNVLEKAMVEAKNVLGEDGFKKLLDKVNGTKV